MTDAALAIETATGEDMTAVVALWTACGLTRPWNDAAADFALADHHANARVLVARRGGVLAGAVMVGHDGHRGAIYYLGVAAEQRRRGVGEALVRAAEAWCRGEGVPKVNLLVRRENLGVLAFYAALGYAENDCVSLYHNSDPQRAMRETADKAAWKARQSRS